MLHQSRAALLWYHTRTMYISTCPAPRACVPVLPRSYIHTFQVTWVKDKEPTLTAEDMQRSSERDGRFGVRNWGSGIQMGGQGNVDCASRLL